MISNAIADATNIKILFEDVPVSKVEQGTFSVSVATREQNHNQGSGWTGKDYGLISGTISGNSKFSFDGTFGYSHLFTYMKNKVKVKVDFTIPVGGITSQFTAMFIITSLEKSGGTGEDATYSYSLESDGDIISGNMAHLFWVADEETSTVGIVNVK